MRETKLMLKIEWLQPVTSVIVDNIKEKSCTEDYLGMYFSNKSKSGGSEVDEVKVFGRGRALVTFKGPNSEFCVLYSISVSILSACTCIYTCKYI